MELVAGIQEYAARLAPGGNTEVFKPADLVPGSAWAVVDVLNRAGLPKGVLNLVMGKGSVVAFGGERLNRETPGFYLQPALFTEKPEG